ncbi:putative F-box domain-containing protein [Medicago truncatula]|uniref:F-box and associated interaction domain protein n=1 Tax=Medicago truncatula TaxID=3880 RepID=G7J0K0_MEDTR|nr:F-box/kelch-repeat protein At3g23880 [Medicago truncatula]AES68761.1 F-box and associated interaction domain protein [Medicago truncatula]RHN65667.1 putative F-box domain-containing protein [Medicago truncatula]
MAYSDSDRHDKKWHRVCDSLHELPPLPTLPSDVILEIICRLPVKFILRFQCVCKSWNSLISDPKFVKKQLCVSTTRNLHFLNYAYDSRKYILTSYPLDSDFTDINSNFTQSDWPYAKFYRFIGSCNGIVCIADNEYTSLVICWNPSTRKFKELPLFEKPMTGVNVMTFGFGYDSSKDNYKVVVVLEYLVLDEDDSFFNKTQVKVHTLGTNIWRTIQDYHFGGLIVPMKGEFVSGTINWLFSKEQFWEYPCFIVSFDLAKESYQKISPPNLGGVDVCDLSALGVLRDCLCVTTSGYDVWLMKEYGNKESWTKLFTISYKRHPSKFKAFAKAIYVFEDDQVLLELYDSDLNLVLYNPRSGTLKATNFKLIPEVCIESLISPSSL